MEADAFRAWCDEVNDGRVRWSDPQLHSFYKHSHEAALRDPLGAETRHIDGTCPAHNYAVCHCTQCGSRPRHEVSTHRTLKSAAEIEADRLADIAKLEQAIKEAATEEMRLYAMEYDEQPMTGPRSASAGPEKRATLPAGSPPRKQPPARPRISGQASQRPSPVPGRTAKPRIGSPTAQPQPAAEPAPRRPLRATQRRRQALGDDGTVPPS